MGLSRAVFVKFVMSMESKCKLVGFEVIHSLDYEEFYLLGYNAV
jgi:hypothetical protein